MQWLKLKKAYIIYRWKYESSYVSGLDSFQLIDEENNGLEDDPESLGVMHVISRAEAVKGTVHDTSNVWFCLPEVNTVIVKQDKKHVG